MKKILFILLSIFLFSSCQKIPPQTRLYLGTFCAINLFDDGTEELYSKIFSELNKIEQTFSVNIENSELSSINNNIENEMKLSDDMFFVLNIAFCFAELSEGNFEPTIGNLVNVWNITSENPKIPSQIQIENALKKTNWKNVQLNSQNKSIKLLSECSLDLGGIVKGFACDKIVSILKQNNVKKAIIDLGGNVYVYGKKSNKEKWRVGVKNPFNPDETILTLEIDEGSVVTSGTYERYFEENGKRYHHILNSKTGFPVQNDIESVTVISKNSIIADVLSTTLFSLGYEKGKDFLEKNKSKIKEKGFDSEIKVIWIKKNGNVLYL